jgi:hypothetical protein
MKNFSSVKIFSISTNNYKHFNWYFIKSFSDLFLPNSRKDFFIFTDDINHESYHEVNPCFTKTFEIKHEPWPFITLKRYEYITNMFDLIRDDDLCIFADIDLEVIKKIDNINTNNFLGVVHPGNYINPNMIESLENNNNSAAFVDKNLLPLNYKYIQGCLWGGIGENFINMVTKLKENTEKDLNNKIIAKWHDESHLNKFCIDNFNNFSFLSSSCAYPENWNLPIEKIIIHKDKNMDLYPRFEGVK